MSELDLFEVVKKTFSQHIDSNVEISVNLTREEVENWDSLRHAMFLVALEKELNQKFDVAAVADLSSINQVIEYIAKLEKADT